MENQNTNLVVVGSAALDDIETIAGKVENELGGSAIYFALSARFFATAGIVGVVGEDFPSSAIAILDENRVNRDGLEVAKGKTFRWSGKYHENFNDRTSIFTHLNVFKSFRPKIPDHYRNARFLFLGNIDPGLQLHVLNEASNSQFVAMDTMNFWIDGKPEMLRKVLQRVDGLLINDSEAKALTGDSNIVTASKKIHKMGPKIVIIKQGKYGALLSEKGKFFYAPAFPLEKIADPTGAGDSFAGGFMGFLVAAKKINWETYCQAVIAGSTIASFNVEDFGVQRLLSINKNIVFERMKAFYNLTHFSLQDN